MRRDLWFAMGGIAAGATIASSIAFFSLKWPLICDINGSLFWSAAGAVSTALAAILALIFGGREMFRSDNMSARRGDIALAMAVPEISRIIAVLAEAEDRYRYLEEHDLRDRGAALKLEKIAPLFRSRLETAGIETFIDMPVGLGIRLPTAIQALDKVEIYAQQIRTIILDARDEFVLRKVQEARAFNSACATDFNEAMDHFTKFINPRQFEYGKPSQEA